MLPSLRYCSLLWPGDREVGYQVVAWRYGVSEWVYENLCLFGLDYSMFLCIVNVDVFAIFAKYIQEQVRMTACTD